MSFHVLCKIRQADVFNSSDHKFETSVIILILLAVVYLIFDYNQVFFFSNPGIFLSTKQQLQSDLRP